MPSTKPLPTIADSLQAAGDALIGERDQYGDTRRGAIYDHATGPMAILFGREADRDRDSFRAIYFDDADGKDLTQYVQGHFDIPRILDTYGTGVAQFVRSSAAAGGGSFLTGSRILIPGTPATEYVVASDYPVSDTALKATVPIRSSARGTGVAINVTGGTITIEDQQWDTSWQCVALTCADGTDFEPAKAYRARARQDLLNGRNGYLTQLVTACQNAGAAYVVAFPSQYGIPQDVFTDADTAIAVEGLGGTINGAPVSDIVVTEEPHGLQDGWYIDIAGVVLNPSATGVVNGTFGPITVLTPESVLCPGLQYPSGSYKSGGIVTSGGQADYGINAIYVADQNFASSAALVNACALALEGVRVLGADLWVGGIVQSPLSIVATLTLVDSPSTLQAVTIKRNAVTALLGYFGPTQGGYTYKRAAMGGAIVKSNPAIQSVSFASPASDPTLSPSAWPTNLTRYTLDPRNIALTLTGPV